MKTIGTEQIKIISSRKPTFLENTEGKIAVPILLYLLGVPGIIVILLWLVFFRGG